MRKIPVSSPYNFSAGPAMLPPSVLERAKDELLSWRGSGMSVMEVSHRGKPFVAMAAKAEADLRGLMDIPDDYCVLFVQGGATLQFSGVPMNIAAPGASADYAITGSWSKKAAKQAGAFVNVNVVADSKDDGYNSIPSFSSWSLNPDAAYLHIASNETIGGVEFHELPETNDVPLVADMSSNILSRPIDVSRYGLIYAGAQKNIGPAGLTVIIVHRSLLNLTRKTTPPVMNYANIAEQDSMLNTPPTFAWYLAALVFEWIQAEGGVVEMGRRNQAKADLLYEFIDASGFYQNPVAKAFRSRMNVPFTLANPDLDGEFLSQAADAGLNALKGHRSVGGMRASMYNAMPLAGAEALVSFMAEFERRQG